MRYQSFTDLLDELTLSSPPPTLSFLSRVREGLAGRYVDPAAIYRAVALAQASPQDDCCSHSPLISEAAALLLRKADAMALRRA